MIARVVAKVKERERSSEIGSSDNLQQWPRLRTGEVGKPHPTTTTTREKRVVSRWKKCWSRMRKVPTKFKVRLSRQKRGMELGGMDLGKGKRN